MRDRSFRVRCVAVVAGVGVALPLVLAGMASGSVLDPDRDAGSDEQVVEPGDQVVNPELDPFIAAAADSDVVGPGSVEWTLEQVSETGRWFVLVEGDSAAVQYAAELAGVSGSGSGSGSVDGVAADVAVPASDARVDLLASVAVDLEAAQFEVAADAEVVLGRDVEVLETYTTVLNGFLVEASSQEAAALLSVPGVASVVPEGVDEVQTNFTPEWLGVPAIWEGEIGGIEGTYGEGTIVGVLDTGVDPENASFAAVDDEGFEHENPYGEGNYVGVCDPESVDFQDLCNSKLIGMYYYNNAPGPVDENGHGSHTAGTAAGNILDREINTFTGQVSDVRISGMAPRANIISYNTCPGGVCPESGRVAAVEQAVQDGVDVINHSIGTTNQPWANPVNLAFLDANLAGIVIANASGNSGPGPYSSASLSAPWTLSVGATHNNSALTRTGTITADEDVPAELQEVILHAPGSAALGDQGLPPTELVIPTGEVEIRGCSPFTDEGQFEGKIILLNQTLDCGVDERVANAKEVGAAGIARWDVNSAGGLIVGGAYEAGDFPVLDLLVNAEGAELEAFVREADGPVFLSASESVEAVSSADWGRTLAYFSSRGPDGVGRAYQDRVPGMYLNLPQPHVVAPGALVFAAVNRVDDRDAYAFLAGTSMAAPHVAGAAALLTAARPDWDSTEVSSALVLTADPEVKVAEEDRRGSATEVGGGLVQPAAAVQASLVMPMTAEEYKVIGNPGAGGDERLINAPSITDKDCADECSVPRTVVNSTGTTNTYQVSTEIEGASLSVEPTTFTLAPGESQDLRIGYRVEDPQSLEWAFGGISIAASGGAGTELQESRLAVALRGPDAEESPGASVRVEPDAVEVRVEPGGTATASLTIDNRGVEAGAWSLGDDPGLLAFQPGNRHTPALELGGDPTGELGWPTPGLVVADDLDLGEGEVIRRIQIEGNFEGYGANGAVIEIRADDNGQPAGEFGDGEALARLPQRAPGWDRGWKGAIPIHVVDLVEAGVGPLSPGAGKYWIVASSDTLVFPGFLVAGSVRMSEVSGQGSPAVVGDLRLGDDFAWEPVTETDLTPAAASGLTDLAFSVQDTAGECPTAEWLSVGASSGELPGGGSEEVGLSVDASGLQPGVYETVVCVDVNNRDESTSVPNLYAGEVVPVRLTVAEPGEVVRVGGGDRYEVAVGSTQRFEPGVDAVFVATGDAYADALTGSALAGSGQAPLLLTRGDHLPLVTAAELERLAPQRVFVLGGSSAVSARVAGLIESAAGVEPVRLGGADRYEVAVEIAERFESPDVVFVASGEGFADGLAAASRAGAVDAPVLLVQQDNVPHVTRGALERIGPGEIVVVGGSEAVSDGVLEQLGAISEVRRVGGEHRYEVAVGLAEESVDPSGVVVTTGQNWPDALVGGALAASLDQPLVLVQDDLIPEVVRPYLADGAPWEQISILGGTRAVGVVVQEALEELV